MCACASERLGCVTPYQSAVCYACCARGRSAAGFRCYGLARSQAAVGRLCLCVSQPPGSPLKHACVFLEKGGACCCTRRLFAMNRCAYSDGGCEPLPPESGFQSLKATEETSRLSLAVVCYQWNQSTAGCYFFFTSHIHSSEDEQKSFRER